MATLNDESLNLLFREARTYTAWLDRPVSDDTLRQIYEVMKWGPTSSNGSPARISPFTPGQGETAANSGVWQHRKDHDRAGHRDCRVRPHVLR